MENKIKEEIEKADWQKLCDECSTATEKVGLTQADIDRIVKEAREIQEKANKYDSLVEKIKDKIEELDKLIVEAQKELGSASKEYTIYVYQKEILQELLKEVEDE